MSARPRRARLRALAKINLSLKVLGLRADGYHELRTVFQTISLADTLEVEFEPAGRTRLEASSRPEIPGNLVERAVWLALEAMRVTGRITLRLRKRIPVGSGLGGGSSDAAAILLALPVLAGRRIPLARLIELGGELGSDVRGAGPAGGAGLRSVHRRGLPGPGPGVDLPGIARYHQ
jgi:4-diphosphocytidyl-2-C-methyl-D-erythritol kinase